MLSKEVFNPYYGLFEYSARSVQLKNVLISTFFLTPSMLDVGVLLRGKSNVGQVQKRSKLRFHFFLNVLSKRFHLNLLTLKRLKKL